MPHGAASNHPDSDKHKGAVEDDLPHPRGERPELHGSLSGQIGHRKKDPLEEGADTDYPEPGSNPEHSGQHS
jgi:hypothetical protein